MTSLERIFHSHAKWDRLKTIVRDGADYPMIELEHNTRQQDLQAGMRRGNHPGSKVFQSELEKKLKKELDHGWMLPLPEETANLLHFAEYCPTSIVEQMTIDEEGTFIDKGRPIHDQSFRTNSNTSVNGRVHK